MRMKITMEFEHHGHQVLVKAEGTQDVAWGYEVRVDGACVTVLYPSQVNRDEALTEAERSAVSHIEQLVARATR